MKKTTLYLATLLTLSGAAHAVGTITGLTSVPATPVTGESVKFKMTTTGSGQCGVRLVYAGSNYEPSDNALINTQPNGGGVIDKSFTKAGTYMLKAMGSPTLNPNCNGEATMTLVVKEKPAANPGPVVSSTPVVVAKPNLPLALAETICPAPYTKSTQGLNVAKGEALCIKSAATCPEGYNGKTNDQTGQLTCTPKNDPQSPLGWTLGSASGVLIFNSIPQPMVFCPKSTPDWQWGTTYYKESWNRMGCTANIKPAY
jgi:hypothetical protein